MNTPCPLRAHLLEQWRYHRDHDALDRLLGCVPQWMPSGSWIDFRDDRIADIAVWLRSVLRTNSRNHVAEIIADAGVRLTPATPRSLNGSQYAELHSSERAELADRLRRLIELRPPQCVSKWPGARQINAILDRENIG